MAAFIQGFYPERLTIGLSFTNRWQTMLQHHQEQFAVLPEGAGGQSSKSMISGQPADPQPSTLSGGTVKSVNSLSDHYCTLKS